MKVLILGSQGLVGRALNRKFESNPIFKEVIASNRHSLNLFNQTAVKEYITKHSNIDNPTSPVTDNNSNSHVEVNNPQNLTPTPEVIHTIPNLENTRTNPSFPSSNNLYTTLSGRQTPTRPIYAPLTPEVEGIKIGKKKQKTKKKKQTKKKR